MDSAIQVSIHWIAQLFYLTFIHWIVIYPVVSTIQLLNNWGLSMLWYSQTQKLTVRQASPVLLGRLIVAIGY